MHCDLENQQKLNRLGGNPAGFIDELKGQDQNVVVTWGFVPDEVQTNIVLQFRAAGFTVIWLDGNRPAAFREFQKRGTVSDELFHAQMDRIEKSGVVQRLRPVVINSFDEDGKFKRADRLLEEIRPHVNFTQP